VSIPVSEKKGEEMGGWEVWGVWGDKEDRGKTKNHFT